MLCPIKYKENHATTYQENPVKAFVRFQVAPLSISVSPCGLMICRSFFVSVDDFVDESGI